MTRPMSGPDVTDRNTIDLAREVLGMNTHDDEDEFSYVSDDDFNRAAWIAPDLARAVIDLTAERDAYVEENMRLREQTARVRALADCLEALADELTEDGHLRLAAIRATDAASIHHALTDAAEETPNE